ncbi:MAG: two pore domain potassium channel family protein, partial [Firmicutes bacterium]|nr:two pore domain potassium channel family protein [Bacillota bacterium]
TYVLLSALVVFNVEPDTFDSFFDAIYWAVVSLTTVGYGDIYPVSTLGRIVTMISSVFGMAIIALPAGIITAGFMQELEKRQISGAGKGSDQEPEPEQEQEPEPEQGPEE